MNFELPQMILSYKYNVGLEQSFEKFLIVALLLLLLLFTGITLWSCQLSRNCKYHAMQNNFHTLTAEGKPHAIQFAE